MGEKTRDEFGVGDATSQHSENIQAHINPTPISRLEVNMHNLATLSVQSTVTQNDILKRYLAGCMERSPAADRFQVLSGVGGKRGNFDAYQ